MKFFHRFYRHLPWINLPVAALLALLQRTPVLRVATAAESAVVGSPVGQVLRSALTAIASLGAMHTLAGVTQFSISRPSPVSGTVGTPISPSIAFTVTGANQPAGSFRITNLPPGVTVAGANAAGLLNSSTGVISGTPTTAGTYSTTILAYEFNNGLGDTFGPAIITFNISGPIPIAPAITLQPVSQTITVGGRVTFNSNASGDPIPTYQWRKDGVPIDGATNISLTLTNVQPAQAGAYTVVATNSASSATSNPATLTVTPAAAVPTIVAHPPAALNLIAGQSLALNVSANGTGLSYEWRRVVLGSFVNVEGATSSTLTIKPLTLADAGTYYCTVSNSGGAVDSTRTVVAVAAASANPGRLINLSVLTALATPGDSFSLGYVVSGATVTNAKPLVIRAAGPSLGALGVPGTLADPKMELFAGSTKTTENDNWAGSATVAAAMVAVGAFPYASTVSLDAAMVADIIGRDNSVAISAGATAPNATGAVIGEVYDATPSASFNPATTPRLINLSVRKDVGALLTMGFVIGGSTSKTMLVRAVGPTLAAFGVGGTIADPKVEIFDSTGRSLALNDNWGGTAALSGAFTDTGAFGLGTTSADAALLITLAPGNYTAQVTVSTGTTGVALVEVYEVP